MRNFGAKAWIYRQYNYRNCRRQSRVMFGTQTYKKRCKSMSNHIVVSSISYAPISGEDQEVGPLQYQRETL